MSVPTTTMRIDPELKDEANKVLGELGLSLSGAVTIFLKASSRAKPTRATDRRSRLPMMISKRGGGQALMAC